MGTIVRQSSLGLVANYVGIILGFVNVMLIMPSILQAEQIGLINLILAVIFIVYPVLDFSASHIINRYFTHVENRQEIFNYSFMISCTGAVVFGFIFWVGKPFFVHYYQENSPEIIPYYWCIYVFSIIMSWTALAENLSIINGKYHVSIFSKEVIFRICILIILIGLSFHLYSFHTYIYLHFLMYGLSGIVILLYLKRQGLFQLSRVWPKFQPAQKKKIYKFGVFTIFSGLAIVIATRIDMIMLGSMEGLKDVGIYTIAMFMSSTIEVPRRAIIQSSAPIIRVFFNERNIEKVAQIQYKTIMNLILIGGFMLTLIVINLQSIYAFIPNGSVYAKGFWVVFFIGLSKMADMMAGSSDEILVSSKYYIYNLVFIIILTIISIGFNYLFIPLYGLTGAAVATLISTSIIVIIKSLTMRYLFNIKPYSFKMLGTLLFFFVIGGLLFMMPNFIHPIISIIIKGSICSLAMYLFLKLTKISPDMNQLINQILVQIKLDKWLKI